MIKSDIRTGVIGVGSMGKNHARVYSEMSDLRAVCDTDENAVKAIAEKYGCQPYLDIDEMISDSGVEAVSVATPTVTHVGTAVKCLEAGLDILVEKPIADSVEAAEKIIETAKRGSKVLAVGMIERHNPVVRFMKDLLEKETIGRTVTISSRRVSNFPSRIKDVGVITDLGVHDIDVIRYLAGGEVRTVYGIGGKVRASEFEDHATVMLGFDNGIEGIIEVSWLTPMKLRNVTVTGVDGVAEMDYVDQEVKIMRSSFRDLDMGNLWMVPINYDTERLRVRMEEPLKREIADFLSAVEKREGPLVSGQDGLEAVRIAKAAERSIREKKVIELGGR